MKHSKPIEREKLNVISDIHVRNAANNGGNMVAKVPWIEVRIWKVVSKILMTAA